MVQEKFLKQFISIYKHVDGREVEVTEVTSNPNPKPNFDDVIYVGQCRNWLRKKTRPNRNIMPFLF